MSKVTITLVPGLDAMIQELAARQFGEDAAQDPVEQNLEILLPDLIGQALAPSGAPAEQAAVQFGPGEDGFDKDVRSVIEEAERQLSEPEVRLPLEIQSPVPEAQEQVAPTFEELTKDKRVHPDAVEWARGNPAKEAALVETLMGLHVGLWGLSQVPAMAERTYTARTQGNDA